MNNSTKTRGWDGEMPHNVGMEHTLLGTLTRHHELMGRLGDIIDEDLFYYDTEKAIFRTIKGLIAEGSKTSTNLMVDYARTHDVGCELHAKDFAPLNITPNLDTLMDEVERLRLMERQRRAWHVLQEAAALAIDPTASLGDTLSEAVETLGDITREINDKGFASFREAVAELTGIVDDNRAGKERSLHTGYALFDQRHLLRPGTLTVIAAFTSVGKSALAMNIAVNVAKGGAPTAYYSLEMGKAELAARAVSPAIGIPASVIANEALSEAGFRRYAAAAPGIGELPIYIDERSTVSFDATVSSIRMMAKTKGVRLVIIDYLQIYTQTTDNVEASLGQMARAAKNVAIETGAAVILLSQLNRSSDTPSLKMLRGSGQIEESADNVVLIDRPGAYPDGPGKFKAGKFKGEDAEGKATLVLAKGRGVGTDERLVSFTPDCTLFADIMTQEDIEKAKPKEETDNLPF